MLAAAGLSAYGFTVDNFGAAPSATPGTSVIPGASNVEGTYTQIFTAANVAFDCYWITVYVSGGGASATQKDHLLDIGVDAAGGTSYTTIISNILCGGTSTPTVSPGVRAYCFPLFIKAASTVAVRIQGNNATAGTVRVAAKLHGCPSNQELVPVGLYSETIGTITNSAGVAVTPVNGSFGSYASLGTTAQDLWWWQLCMQCSSTAMAGSVYWFELAYGDVTNKVTIMSQLVVFNTAEVCADAFMANLPWMNCYRPVPAGSTIYCRGRSAGTADTGVTAVAIGVGG